MMVVAVQKASETPFSEQEVEIVLWKEVEDISDAVELVQVSNVGSCAKVAAAIVIRHRQELPTPDPEFLPSHRHSPFAPFPA